MVSSSAESLPSSPAPTGERPKFRSKIHIPVKLAKEVMPLPPPGYELVFRYEFDGSAVDTKRWGYRLESKMLSAQQQENVSVKDGKLVIEDAPDTSAGFHVWACEFTPETTRFYFDGRLAKEISSAGFPHDEMNVWFSVIASTLKGDRWVDESKLPNAVFCDYIRVYQHPKYLAAEASVRAEVLRPRPPLDKKNLKPKGPKLKDLN